MVESCANGRQHEILENSPVPIPFLIATLLALSIHNDGHAIPANAWHIPDNSGDAAGSTCATREFEIGNNTVVTVYTGEQKFNNSFGTSQPDRRLGGLQGRFAGFLEQQCLELLPQRQAQPE